MIRVSGEAPGIVWRENVVLPRNPLRRVIVITHWQKPWTVNTERSRHWHEHRRRTAEWRQCWYLLGLERQVPHLERVRVTAVPIRPGKRRQDVGACLPAVKAAIDGLVDAGMLDNDGPEHVTELRFLPEKLGTEYGLELTIEEVLSAHVHDHAGR